MIKKVLFIRHAKSDWSFPELADFERPLNKRGKKDAPEMGRRLRNREDIRPQLIKVSTAERTKETMDLLKKEAGWENIETVEKDWMYLASANEYIKSIEKMHDEIDFVCFCGHNPTVTYVLNYFSGENIDDMPTCAIGLVEFDVESWKHISQNSGKLTYYDYPKSK